VDDSPITKAKLIHCALLCEAPAWLAGSRSTHHARRERIRILPQRSLSHSRGSCPRPPMARSCSLSTGSQCAKPTRPTVGLPSGSTGQSSWRLQGDTNAAPRKALLIRGDLVFRPQLTFITRTPPLRSDHQGSRHRLIVPPPSRASVDVQSAQAREIAKTKLPDLTAPPCSPSHHRRTPATCSRHD